MWEVNNAEVSICSIYADFIWLYNFVGVIQIHIHESDNLPILNTTFISISLNRTIKFMFIIKTSSVIHKNIALSDGLLNAIIETPSHTRFVRILVRIFAVICRFLTN